MISVIGLPMIRVAPENRRRNPSRERLAPHRAVAFAGLETLATEALRLHTHNVTFGPPNFA